MAIPRKSPEARQDYREDRQDLKRILASVYEPEHPCQGSYDALVLSQDVFSDEHMQEMRTLHDHKHIDFILLFSERILNCTDLAELERVWSNCQRHLKYKRSVINASAHDLSRMFSILTSLEVKRSVTLQSQVDHSAQGRSA